MSCQPEVVGQDIPDDRRRDGESCVSASDLAGAKKQTEGFAWMIVNGGRLCGLIEVPSGTRGLFRALYASRTSLYWILYLTCSQRRSRSIHSCNVAYPATPHSVSVIRGQLILVQIRVSNMALTHRISEESIWCVHVVAFSVRILRHSESMQWAKLASINSLSVLIVIVYLWVKLYSNLQVKVD